MPAYTSVTLIGQQAKRCPSCNSPLRSSTRFRLPLMASMMTLVSSRNVAISAGVHFLKTLLILPAQLGHPLGSSLFEFGMIFVFPGSGCGFERLELPEAH